MTDHTISLYSDILWIKIQLGNNFETPCIIDITRKNTKFVNF